ncbi:MAG: META domain-containing protein [Acidimicrobiia bacterium]|nr:META domain-containing protein [Acidimicrobiia bacterium]
MKVALLIAAAVVVAACGGGEPAGEPANTSSLPDTTATPSGPDGDWRLIDGLDLVDDFPVTMAVSGSQVGGRAACNSYFGTATVSGSSISIGQLGQTEMACEPAVMELESAFTAALMAADTFSREGDRMTLTGPSVELVFELIPPIPTADLVGVTWVLDTVIQGETASSVAGDPATLVLNADGTLEGSTGCRSLEGRWQESGGVIVVPELSADGECPPELADQDSQVVTVVGDEFTPQIDGDRLTLTSMGGDGLVYRLAP